MYREAWERGIKTTYYLRTLNKSSIDNAIRDRRLATQKRDAIETETLSCSIEAQRNGVVREAANDLNK